MAWLEALEARTAVADGACEQDLGRDFMSEKTWGPESIRPWLPETDWIRLFQIDRSIVDFPTAWQSGDVARDVDILAFRAFHD